MRVQDDLSAGRSRFQAEVWQLRQALDTVAEAKLPVVLVFDEILSGTNSRERFIGTRPWKPNSKAMLQYLRNINGCVMVTTHDLELAAIADEPDTQVTLSHFADRAELCPRRRRRRRRLRLPTPRRHSKNHQRRPRHICFASGFVKPLVFLWNNPEPRKFSVL